MLSGLLQSSALFSIFGVKPNLILIILIASAQWIEVFSAYLPVLLLGIILAQFFPGIGSESLSVGLIGLLAFGAAHRLHGRSSVNNLVLTVSGTVAFYLLTNAGHIFQSPWMLIGEVIYNAFLGIIFLKFFQPWLAGDKDSIFQK